MSTHPDRPLPTSGGTTAATTGALRLSVTDRCNLRCAYCMSPDDSSAGRGSEGLSPEERARVVLFAVEELTISKIKITGGEPLLHRGLPDLVSRLANAPGEPEISLTTNGALLERKAAALYRAGLSRVNVSLDTLDPDRYRRLTRGGTVERAVGGIRAARRTGLDPVKINTVLCRSSWKGEVPALLDFAAAQGVSLRFLELMHTGTRRPWWENEQVEAAVVVQWSEEHPECSFPSGSRPRDRGAAPARTTPIVWRGTLFEVGWILPLSHPFCAACDRLRLDSSGRLRRCLMDPAALPLAEILRVSGEATARRQLAAYLAAKRPPLRMSHLQPMVGLGG